MGWAGTRAKHLDLRHELFSHSKRIDAADHHQHKFNRGLFRDRTRPFGGTRQATWIAPRPVKAAPQPIETPAVRALPAGRRRAAMVALFGGAIGIGFAPILVRFSEVGPSATAAFRILLALPILWVLVLLERRSSDTPQPKTFADFKFLAIAGLFFAGDLSLWHWSLQITTVANSTLLTNFAPIFVTIGASF